LVCALTPADTQGQYISIFAVKRDVYCIRTLYEKRPLHVKRNVKGRRRNSPVDTRGPYISICTAADDHRCTREDTRGQYISIFAATHRSAMYLLPHTAAQCISVLTPEGNTYLDVLPQKYIVTLIATETHIYIHSPSPSMHHCRSLPCNTLRHSATLCNTLQHTYLHSLPQTDTGAHEE